MIKVKISRNKEVFVSFTDDTFPNKGGYYCQIYNDEMLEDEIGNFVISKQELTNNTKEEIAKRQVKHFYTN